MPVKIRIGIRHGSMTSIYSFTNTRADRIPTGGFDTSSPGALSSELYSGQQGSKCRGNIFDRGPDNDHSGWYG